MLIGASAATVVLPARSLPLRCAAGSVWPTPSRSRRSGSGHDATPESASAHLKPTTTSFAYQPFPFGLFTVVVTAGPVLSIETVKVPVAQFELPSQAGA